MSGSTKPSNVFLNTRYKSNTFKMFILENQNVFRFVTPNILIFCYERAKFLSTRYEFNAFKKIYCGKPKCFPIRYTNQISWYFVMREPNFWAPGTNLIHLKRFIVENQNVFRFVTTISWHFVMREPKFEHPVRI